MNLTEMLTQELYEKFFPFTNEEDLEEKLEEEFTTISTNIEKPLYFVDKMFGKKFIVVNDRVNVYIFIYSEKELVILLLSDYNGFTYRNTLKDFDTRSVTSINIIAQDKWMDKNIEIVDIVNLISKNNCHIGNEYLIKGETKIKSFYEEALNSPLLWYLSRENVSFKRYGPSSKTKSSFLNGTIRVIMNSLYKQDTDIFQKDMTEAKESLFGYFLNKLLRENPRKFLMEDIQSRNHLIFSTTLYPKMFATHIYEEDRWNDYLKVEVIPYIKEDFIDFLEKLSGDDMNDSIISGVRFYLSNMVNKKGKPYFKNTYKDIDNNMIKQFFLTYPNYYADIINELIDFVDDNFNDILSGENKNRKNGRVKAPKFPKKLYDEIAEKYKEMLEERRDMLEVETQQPSPRRRRRGQVISVPSIAINDEDDIPF